MVYRKLRNNELWQKPEKLQAWLDLLFEAEYERKEKNIKGSTILINRGEKEYSRRYLMNKWSWSDTKLNNFLNYLEKANMITIKKTGIYHRPIKICIENYDLYQTKTDNTKTPDSQRVKSDFEKQSRQSADDKTDNKTDNCKITDRQVITPSKDTPKTTIKATKKTTHNNITNNKEAINIPSNRNLPESYFDLSLKFHQIQKKNGLHHKDFNKELTYETAIVKNGAEAIDRLIRLDGESLEDVKETLRFVLTDDFWQSQVVSLASIRKKSKNGNTKYFNIKNSMKRKQSQKQKFFSPEELIEKGVKPIDLEKGFICIDNNKYKPNEYGRNLIDG